MLSSEALRKYAGLYQTADRFPSGEGLEPIISLGSKTVIFGSDAVYTEPLIFTDPAYPGEKSIVCLNHPLLNNYLHFLEHVMKNKPEVRILDLGGNPMTLLVKKEAEKHKEEGRKISFEDEFCLNLDANYPLVAVLSLHPRVKAISVDVQTPPENSRWLNANFLTGDFTDPEVQQEAVALLDGRPDIIICNRVLINDLVKVMQQDLYGRPLLNPPPVKPTLVEDLAQAAFSLLDPGGFVMVQNGFNFEKERMSCQDNFLPSYLRQRTEQLAYFYIRNLMRVYRKD